MKVPFINYPRAYAAIKPEIDEAITGCLKRGDLIFRDDLKRFEDRFAQYSGRKYGIGTGSCTGAMFLALKVLGVGPGDEVITVSHTYIATIDVIKACGATPILVDVEYDSMNMDMKKAAEAVTKRTAAIIPVHLNSLMCNMDELRQIVCWRREGEERPDIPVIVDAAQAVGAKYKGRIAGSWGKFGCFSFYPAKILGGYGEGGMIITDDLALAERLYLHRDHGELPKYRFARMGDGVIFHWGFNTMLDNIQAAALNVKLRYLDKAIERRREIAMRYSKNLNPISEFVIPKADWNSGTYYHVFQNYVIKVPVKRDELQHFLYTEGIETMVHWRVPNHKQIGLGLDHFELPVTERLSREVLSLPMYPELTDDEVDYVCENIRSFFA